MLNVRWRTSWPVIIIQHIVLDPQTGPWAESSNVLDKSNCLPIEPAVFIGAAKHQTRSRAEIPHLHFRSNRWFLSPAISSFCCRMCRNHFGSAHTPATATNPDSGTDPSLINYHTPRGITWTVPSSAEAQQPRRSIPRSHRSSASLNATVEKPHSQARSNVFSVTGARRQWSLLAGTAGVVASRV